ncbi:MAG TPA: transglycosylase SLT domain-containing protein, partial [Polyangiales bacterium]
GLPATRRALKQPYINVALGAAFLGQLLQQYKGQTPLAIAAYNAGGERVNEWLKRTGRCELDRWVEEIPVEQTRNYVRRVITAWARYQLLATPSDPWTVPLPTHVSLSRE